MLFMFDLMAPPMPRSDSCAASPTRIGHTESNPVRLSGGRTRRADPVAEIAPPAAL